MVNRLTVGHWFVLMAKKASGGQRVDRDSSGFRNRSDVVCRLDLPPFLFFFRVFLLFGGN